MQILKHFINVTLGDSTVKFKSRLFVFFKITIKNSRAITKNLLKIFGNMDIFENLKKEPNLFK